MIILKEAFCVSKDCTKQACPCADFSTGASGDGRDDGLVQGHRPSGASRGTGFARCFPWGAMAWPGLAIAPVVELVIPVATVVGEKHFGRCCENGCDCHMGPHIWLKLLYASDMMMIWCCLMFEYNWSAYPAMKILDDDELIAAANWVFWLSLQFERSNWISNGTKNWLGWSKGFNCAYILLYSESYLGSPTRRRRPGALQSAIFGCLVRLQGFAS